MADVQAKTSAGQDVALDEIAVNDFVGRLRGEVLRPGGEGYEEARHVWNGMIDKRPYLIARCDGVIDIVESVNFARAHDLSVAVRGGGHNVAGMAVSDGGLVIDLSHMREVLVNHEERTARVQGGANWGDVDKETQKFGLATPGGIVSDTGVAGLTLGGGLGWLRRKYGLSCDNLTSVDVVTADGRLLIANEHENADLFWGLHGGGGNFGVVTSFEFRLHPAGPEVMFAYAFYPIEVAADALRFYRNWSATAPDEISSIFFLATTPQASSFPAEAQGVPCLVVAACYAGEVDEGERALQPLRQLGTPIVDLSGPRPFVEVQTIFDEEYPRGRQYYWKSLYLDDFGDEAIARLLSLAAQAPSPLTTVDIWQLGGAISHVATDETAIARRRAPFLLNAESNWEDPAEATANIDWTRRCVAEMQQYSKGGLYLNFPGFLEEGQKGLAATFGNNYERLVALKNKYDPTNLFRLNQNITPDLRKAA
ncbi:MAG: FAD-binding oxidoreductase [Chloroflexota bacterium]